MSKPHWVANICYRHEEGFKDDLFAFDRLSQLHGLVGGHANLNTIINIVVTPADRCSSTIIEKATLL